MFEKNLRQEITQIADENGIEPAALLAVVEVESNGRVSAKVNGRAEPLIRFEGHYFYRLLSQSKRNIAVTKGLAHRSVGKVKNPLTQKGRWALLKKCEALDRGAALQSVSWGVGQVMGSHWHWLDYASIDDLVFKARSGLQGQVELMVRYIKKAGLFHALHECDWRSFARGYNGPIYAKYKYHTKLASAYLKYAGEKHRYDNALGNEPLMLRFGSQGSMVRQLQRALNGYGFTLFEDGDFGPATKAAVIKFQAANRIFVDGIAGPQTFIALQRNQPSPSKHVT